MVAGASVYSGDTIATGADAKGVLIFRDDSRLTLGTNTKFKVDSFVFDEKTPGEGNFLISLLRGSMRALTGIIGKTNKRNVSFKTPTATVGIRGTGLDLDCSEEENCKFFTWLGSIDVMRMGQTGIQTLQAGQGLWVSKTQSSPITASTLDNMQRPDKVPVNVPQLFSSGTASADDEGLFVYVREGHIEVTSTTQQTLHLGRGETGFAGNDGRTGRPAVTPLFIQFDKVPMPNQANPMLYSVLGEVSQPSSNQCR